jgi:aminotransferase
VSAAPEVIQAARKVHDFLTVGAAAPLQEGAVTALELPMEYYDELRRWYTERRDLFLGYLDQAGLPYTVPQGAYYVLADVSGFKVTDDLAFCRWLAEKIGVAAVPGSSFFHEPVNHLVRFHFARKKKTLEECGNRLQRLKDAV